MTGQARLAGGRNLDFASALRDAEDGFRAANPKSERKWLTACETIPAGSTRTSIFYTPFPLTMQRGEGAKLWDLDEHLYTDFLNDFTAGLYGHSHPVIRQAISAALANGVSLGANNLYDERLAHLMCQRFPSLEMVRFTNSGTESNLMAVLAARAITGRDKVLVFERAYHGGVFIFAKGHSKLNLPIDFVMGHYNDTERTLAAIAASAKDLAAIVVEPMMGAGGCIPATRAFLQALREAASRHGIVLIFDEVMTSRLAPGGLQEEHRVIPDMTTFGKYLGGGMTFGAFGGRRDIMERFDVRKEGALQHAGTYNNNVLSMAAGVAGLTEVFTPEAARELSERGERLRTRLNGAAANSSIPLQVTGRGSMLNVHFHDTPLTTPEAVDDTDKAALSLFHLDMLARGQHLARRGFMSLSLPLNDADCERFVAAVEDFLAVREPVLGR